MNNPEYSPESLPSRLANNSNNYLTYFDSKGALTKTSYNQLHKEALRLYAALIEDGVKNGVRVGLLANSTYEWVCLAVAVIYTGAELVAIPESLSNDELECSLSGLEVKLILTDKDTAAIPSLASYTVKNIGKYLAASQERCVNDVVVGNPVATRMIAFTSGSTSTSTIKAFDVRLDSTIAFSSRFKEIYNIAESDNWLVIHSFSHVVHFEYVLGGLYWGFNITLANAFQLLTQGKTLNPSVVVTVPNVYQQLAGRVRRMLMNLPAEADSLETLENRVVSDDSGKVIRYPACKTVEQVLGANLKVMIIGASPSSAGLQQFLLQIGIPLYEGYGMSELNMISANTPDCSLFGSVGKVWPGVEVKIDEEGCILARTNPDRSSLYLNTPAAVSADTFIGDGWINTGDVGVYSNGVLTITGRKKEVLVNEGGENINPSYIEQKLQSMPGIEYAMVYGDQKPYLVAVLSQTKNASSTREAINSALEKLNGSLPNYMRIQSFVLAKEPFTVDLGTLTRSGKVRRNRVAELYKDDLEALYAPLEITDR